MPRLVFQFAITVVVLICGVYTTTTLARLFVQWRSSRGRNGDAAMEERLARLESTVETVAAENQRLQEGQRFFTQLLAARPPAEVGRLPAGSSNGRGA
jgi:hypothetical protein